MEIASWGRLLASSLSDNLGVGASYSSMEGVGIPESSLDFTFGFDDPKYSDRTLHVQILDEGGRNVKRHRLDDDLITPATVPRVKTIHINSMILAARSPFFLKLFSNGMLESEQKNVTLRIDTSEETSLMDLLKYVYSNNLPTTLNALLNLLVIADKFEVASCSRDCTRSLRNFPMTCELASLYLDLPQNLTIQPIVDAAKQFLVANFKDFHKLKEEMLNLPLASIRAILSSDDLQVTSECVVYDFVLTWARKHYPDLEERREILKTHLLHLIRFPLMTTTKLAEEVQTCIDIDPEVSSKIVLHALRFKAETPHQKRCLAAREGNTTSRQFVERAYKNLHITVVELDVPRQQCIVYLHLTKEKLTHIFPEDQITDQIMSETFHLGEQEFVLSGRCYTFHKSKAFELNLEAVGSATFTIDYETQLRSKHVQQFNRWMKGSHRFTESARTKFLGSIPWTTIIHDDCPFFINNILHLRAELTIKKC